MRKFTISVGYEEPNIIHQSVNVESGNIPIEYQCAIEELYDELFELISDKHIAEIWNRQNGGAD